ncbi:MAG: flagellar hook basal-body protein [Bryobacteraceae bacterium]
MDSLLIAAASGMKSRMESLDMLANNIANTNTSGFKADREFYSVYKDGLPVIEGKWTDLSQGTITTTGNPLDLALSGPGFFAINGANGIEYTRNGSFVISKANQLATTDGFTLRNMRDQGRPIAVNPTQPIAIDRRGVVSQGGQEVGQIEITSISSAAGSLAKLGNSYFSLSKGSADPAAPVAAAEVIQGGLERSNVSPSDSAIRLVNVMRQFEMLERALRIGSDMNKQATQEVARV